MNFQLNQFIGNGDARWYTGSNLHAYTHFLRDQLQQYTPHAQGELLTLDEWNQTMAELERYYGYKPALLNIKQHYRDGQLLNNELPGLNTAIVLNKLWKRLQQINEPSLFQHFGETLDQIAMTCLAGVTDRIMQDWMVISEQKK